MYLVLNLILNIVNAYTFILVVYALLSWFPGAYDTGLGRLIGKICDPYLSLFSHLRLNIGPLNFTVWIAILVLNLASRAIVMIFNSIL